MASIPGGYQPNTRQPASRRADFDLLRRIARLEILGGPDAGGTNEVTIGGLAPTDSSELWVSSAGILYAKMDDEWIPVSSGTGGADEVWVGPTAPAGTNYELWYDSDADAGIPGLSYKHTQGTPASIWSIAHNLGWYPNVTVIDSGGSTVEGDTEHLTVNTMRLLFSASFSGVAYLS